jgi:hypothetical protein
VAEILRSPGQPLDIGTRAFMEPRFGYDFSQVRVHTDVKATESARAVNALAYTVGRHVVFDARQYAPGTSDGRRLIAHELAHVLQQRENGLFNATHLRVNSPQDLAEREAENTATLVTSGSDAKVPTYGQPQFQRQTSPVITWGAPCPFPSDFNTDRDAALDMMCITDASKNRAPSCTLTDKHLDLLDAAKADAKQRVQKALFRMYATGGPEFVQRVAQRVFTDEPPTNEVIKTTLEAMNQILQGQTLTFVGATCADAGCESDSKHAAAYETAPGQPVVICPRSFLPDYVPELSRTVIHEAVHLSGIDIDPNIMEEYCLQYTCDAPCQEKTFADAWALFIDCIGGPLSILPPSEVLPLLPTQISGTQS